MLGASSLNGAMIVRFEHPVTRKRRPFSQPLRLPAIVSRVAVAPQVFGAIYLFFVDILSLRCLPGEDSARKVVFVRFLRSQKTKVSA